MVTVFLLLASRPAQAQVPCTPDTGYTTCQAFTYTGSDQSFTVPDGVTSIKVQAWGAGAGGSINAGLNIGAPGGSGGYVEGILDVTAGSQYVIVTGEGGGADGTPSTSDRCDAAYGFGGACPPARSGGNYVDGGGGGGLSGLFTGSAAVSAADNGRAVFVAGGGGAGEGTNACGSTSAAGGAAGNAFAGTMPTMQGVHGVYDTTTPGINGANPTGGGGGYLGGAGTDRLRNGTCVTSANGGSNFITGTGVSGGINMAGNEAASVPDFDEKFPPETTDSQYITGVGVGQRTLGEPGGDGLVVLQWADPLPTFACTTNAPGYLTQHSGTPPTEVAAVDLVTGTVGSSPTVADHSLNAAGYNVLDDYVYAWDWTTEQIVRVGSDGSVVGLGVPVNHLGTTVEIAVGDIDENGHYWYVHWQSQTWNVVDLAPESTTYMETIDSGTIPSWPYAGDWVYSSVDGGGIYTTGSPGDGEVHLFRFDRTSHSFSDLGTLGIPVGTGGPMGGAFFADADGFLYNANNNTGTVWRIDVANTTAEEFAQSDPALNVDGARCFSASVDIDFGDALDSYGTTLGVNGPRHGIVGYDVDNGTAPLMLGATVDPETDGVPSTSADSDGADEDAVANPIVIVPGQPTTVPVSVTNTTGEPATLAGWIDLNGDGQFQSTERVIEPVSAGFTGTVDLGFPAGTTTTDTYARFRLFPGTVADADVLPTGPASAGEVEDYPVTVNYNEININLTGGPCWRMLSSPVQGLTYADMLDGLWTQGAAGSDYPGGTPNIFLWPNGQAANDPAGWQPLGDLNQVIPPGTGFLISVFADDDYDGVDDPFPKTLSVSGPAHTGDITPPMNTTDGGWTLVGNPYIEPVDFNSLTTTDLTGVGYVYDRDTGTWASTTTDGYGDVTDGAFVPGQGFFVQNTDPAGSPSITFTEASRTTGGEFYGKQKELRDYLRLEVQGESLYNSMWIRFSGDGSVEPAYGDALELQPLAEQYALLGARKTDGTLVDIGHFPLPDETLQIPVYVEATQPGSYTLTATDLDIPAGLFSEASAQAGAKFYLHDLETGETVAITESFEYAFTINQAAKSTPDEGITACSASPAKAKTTGAARFMITTSAGSPAGELPDEVALEQNYPNPFNPSTVISYQLPVSSEVRLEVFDLIGRSVATLVDGTAEAGVHQVNFDASHLTSGVYLYRLTANNTEGGSQIFTKKLTLIK